MSSGVRRGEERKGDRYPKFWALKKLTENLLFVLYLQLKTFILRKFRGKIDIVSTVISSVGNLHLSVVILSKISSCLSENCNFLSRLFIGRRATRKEDPLLVFLTHQRRLATLL